LKNLVVAFAFGIPETTIANTEIALIAEKWAANLECPIYTQSEEYLHFDPVLCPNVIQTKEDPGLPAPTLRIARGAVAYAIENGISQIFVVCAKPHLWRCLRDLHKVALGEREYIEIVAVDEIQESKWSEWFCPDCTQLRARSIPVWLFYDLILRCMPWYLYKRIGS
jgi:hypothetical protein